VGRIALYAVFEINFSLFSCSNRRCICVSILAVLSLLMAGPRSRNLVETLYSWGSLEFLHSR